MILEYVYFYRVKMLKYMSKMHSSKIHTQSMLLIIFVFIKYMNPTHRDIFIYDIYRRRDAIMLYRYMD